jgi:hypothetical protein
MVATVLISAILAYMSGQAHAFEPVVTEPTVEQDEFEMEAASPETRLEDAVRLYQTGDPQQAQALLAGLINDSSFENEILRQRARVFLGEVLYLQQSEEEARRIFEAILTLEPNYVLDPFEHPPDVCGFFETIRTYIRPAELPAVSTPVPPTPLSAYLGFGVYQMKHKQRSLGMAMAIGQTTFGAISAIMFAGLLDDRKFTSGVDAERRAVQTRKAIQWTATSGFYGFWGWSVVDANRHWRTNVELHSVYAPSRSNWTDGPQEFHVRLSFPTH